MEFILRDKTPKAFRDLFAEPMPDGSVKFIIKSKNETGEGTTTVTKEDFDLFCLVREKTMRIDYNREKEMAELAHLREENEHLKEEIKTLSTMAG